MELDDFKSTWNEMGNKVNDNEKINLNMFDKMSQKRFHSSLKKIIIPEIAGDIVCIGSAVYVGFNFDRLDKVSFQVVGVLSILLFIILPVISLLSILELYKAGDTSKSYADTVKDFAVQKVKFCKLQKLNLLLSYLLLVTVLLLATKLFGRNEITDSKYFWVFSISFGYIFLLFFSKWVFKSYNKTILQAEDLLNEVAK